VSDREYWRAPPQRSPFWATLPATKGLLIGLAGIHAAMAMLSAINRDLSASVFELLALWPEDVLGRLRIWQLATCALLHVDLWHLAFNAMGIWFFGRLVEQRLGARRYILFALGTVVTASLGYLLLSVLEGPRRPMIGASGLDFGVIVLCAFWYPRLTVLLFFVLPVPLWALAALFVFLEAMMLLEQGGGVAHAAHLGGALYGALYFRFMGHFDQLFSGLGAWQHRRRRRRAERERRDSAELRREVDRILDKVNREGMAALTDAERRVLKDASEKLRR
jgi:membrane associated rhomboid family serine protease